MELQSKRGYAYFEVASAMQKAIRRADGKMAGYWAIEMFESGWTDAVWKRLLTISAEDCAGIITKEITALHDSFKYVNTGKSDPGGKVKGRIFLAKAVLILAASPKSRDADHLTNLVYDRKLSVTDEQIAADLDEARKTMQRVPEYAFDVHTREGRIRGKTKDDFFREEFDALQPKQLGLFDDLVPAKKRRDTADRL